MKNASNWWVDAFLIPVIMYECTIKTHSYTLTVSYLYFAYNTC